MDRVHCSLKCFVRFSCIENAYQKCITKAVADDGVGVAATAPAIWFFYSALFVLINDSSCDSVLFLAYI